MADLPETNTVLSWLLGLLSLVGVGTVKHLHDTIKSARDDARDGDDKIWDAVTEAQRDLRAVATRDDLIAVEARITSAMVDGQKNTRDLIRALIGKPVLGDN